MVVRELQKYNKHSSIMVKLYANSAVKRAIQYLHPHYFAYFVQKRFPRTRMNAKTWKHQCVFHWESHRWRRGSAASGPGPLRWRWWCCCWRSSCSPDPWSCLWFPWRRSDLSSAPPSTGITNRETPLWSAYLWHSSVTKCSWWFPLITDSCCTISQESFSISKRTFSGILDAVLLLLSQRSCLFSTL